MIKKTFSWRKIVILFIAVFTAGVVQGQNICDEEVCVVEFNAGWNQANGVGYLDELTDCGVERVSIDEGTWQADYGIVVVPTIIVFNGKEISRFQADLSFKISVTKGDVQDIINDILLSDF